MRRASLVLAAVLPLLFTLMPVQAYQPPGGGTFNTPDPFGTDEGNYRIVRTVEKAIRETRRTRRHRNPVILIATYLMDRGPSVDALIGACRRGVQVRVILDEEISNYHSRRLITALNGDNVPDRDGDGRADRGPDAGPCNRPLNGGSGTNRETHHELFTPRQARLSVEVPTADSVTWGRDGSYVKRCDGACRGGEGNMHSKFYAFSKTGRARNVVMVSSSNLNKGGAVAGWNDLFVMKGRPESFRGYKTMHRAMTEDIRATSEKVQINDGPYVSRFFPMRNASRERDPVMQDLRRVRCSSSLGRTSIHVSMFYWKGTRGNWITDKLLSLARNGCRVSIIFGAPSRQMADRLRAAARAGLISLWDSRWDFNENGEFEVRTHAKYVLVRGTVGDRRATHQVWTGTANWVPGSLTVGDENTLNVRSRAAYYEYLRNWNTIREHSRRNGV